MKEELYLLAILKQYRPHRQVLNLKLVTEQFHLDYGVTSKKFNLCNQNVSEAEKKIETSNSNESSMAKVSKPLH